MHHVGHLPRIMQYTFRKIMPILVQLMLAFLRLLLILFVRACMKKINPAN